MSDSWRRLLAMSRLSKRAICEQSTVERDYHDYPDSIEHQQDDLGPVHFYQYTCARCGKGFHI